MTFTSLSADRFGGLDLVSDPQEMGWAGAVDLLNVDFDHPGAVRVRWGSAKVNSSTLSSTGYQALFPSPTNGGELLAIRGTGGGSQNIDRLNGNTLTNVGSFASGGAVPIACAAIGTTTATAVYLSFIEIGAGGALRKFNGSALSTGTGKPIHVATWPTSNRLVQGGYFAGADAPAAPSDGSTAGRSTLFFSDPGAPDTYPTTNFIHLRPGDGEVISAIVPFRELLFVFKQSAMFVFYGEGQESDGTPVFSYRRVDLPEPVMDPVQFNAFRAYAIAGPDAVYFSTPLGIYATTGGVPALLTSQIAPLFTLDTNVGASVRTNLSPPTLAYWNQRLIATYTNASSATRQLVLNHLTGQWAIWSLPGASYVTVPAVGALATARELVYFPSGNDIWASGPTATDDGGVAISWSYTSGYQAPAKGQRIKLRGSSVWGTGTATLQILTQGGRTNDVIDPGEAVTLGTSPTVAEGKRRRATRGVLFAHKLSGSGQATISRLTHRFLPPELDY